MGNDNKTITIDDVHQLVEVKNKDPKIEPSDLFRQIDRVRGDFSKEMWRFLWMPLALGGLSTLGMLFLDEDTGAKAWHRLSIISFAVASLWGIYLLRKYEKDFRWIIVFDVLVLYLVYSDTLSLKDLVKHIVNLF